jgi:hypothetical protein
MNFPLYPGEYFNTLTIRPKRGHMLVFFQFKNLKTSYNKSQQDALFLNFILVKNSKCFRQTYCPSSGVLILYSQQLVFVILVMLLSASEVRMELHPDLASRQST